MQLNAWGRRFLIYPNPAKRASAICSLTCLNLKYSLESASFFCKGPSVRYCRPDSLCHNYFQKRVTSDLGSQGEVCHP